MKFILGLIAGVILIPALTFVYLLSGFGPTAATDRPLPFETFIAGMALRARMQKEAPAPRDLSTFTTGDLVAGADIYKKNCAVCHGLPGEPNAAIGNNMFPPAPQLMAPPPPGRGPRGGPEGGAEGRGPDGGGPPPPGAGRGGGAGRGASGDFWRVKNGIRLTGMPSFEKTLTDDQIWQVVAMLANRRDMPPEVKAALQPDAAQTQPAPGANQETTGR